MSTMSTMVENVIAAGSKNRPPMLERSQYDSWKIRMLLYILGKEHGTATSPANTRKRTLDDLTPKKRHVKHVTSRQPTSFFRFYHLMYTLL
ncbi:hypothetical protein Tco_1324017 [Tanacetum coccineum]